MASFPASTCRGGRKYLQGRSQVLAGKVACISVESKRGTEIASPILDKRKGSSDSHMSPYSLQEISAEP